VSQPTTHRLGLKEAAEVIRRGDLTSEDLTQALLSRIERLEARVLAFQWFDPARALELAREADRRQRSGEPPGRIHGIPVGVKDIMETAGIPTSMGSAAFEDYVPMASAAVVRRMEAAGAFLMGKTVTTELAYYTPGRTRNPWNPAHTPGGSSSGSAAAVAMGFVPAALGTQTNGSVIRPAAFCGVVGFKPSAGLISRFGIHPFSPSLDQVGVFARNVPDVALMASTLLGKDGLDPASVECEGVISGEVSSRAQPPRLVAVRSPVWHLADDPAQGHFLETVFRLREAGAGVEEVELPDLFQEAHSVHRTIMHGEGARVLRDLQSRHRQTLSARLNSLIDEGLGIPESALENAIRSGQTLQEELDRFLANFDALITPPTPGEAPRDLAQTGDPAFCSIWTLCGVPAVTIPTGRGPRNVPLGLQIVGQRVRDEEVLSIARWCDERIGWPQRIAV
jgi:Asp-tRNA(Asn)/Glu-tRNA(Gln) amidotransferase A subunit family amidase